MGWFDADHEGHEGYLLGLVEDAAGGGLVAEARARTWQPIRICSAHGRR